MEVNPYVGNSPMLFTFPRLPLLDWFGALLAASPISSPNPMAHRPQQVQTWRTQKHQQNDLYPVQVTSASRLEAIASRLEAIAIRSEVASPLLSLVRLSNHSSTSFRWSKFYSETKR